MAWRPCRLVHRPTAAHSFVGLGRGQPGWRAEAVEPHRVLAQRQHGDVHDAEHVKQPQRCGAAERWHFAGKHG